MITIKNILLEVLPIVSYTFCSFEPNPLLRYFRTFRALRSRYVTNRWKQVVIGTPVNRMSQYIQFQCLTYPKPICMQMDGWTLWKKNTFVDSVFRLSTKKGCQQIFFILSNLSFTLLKKVFLGCDVLRYYDCLLLPDL